MENGAEAGKTSDVIEEARASSKDGVIINNVRDDYNNSRSTRPTRTFTVFESTQIKSSTGNTGAFSPTDPDIRFSAGADWYNGPSGGACTQRLAACQGESRRNPSPKNLDKIIYGCRTSTLTYAGCATTSRRLAERSPT